MRDLTAILLSVYDGERWLPEQLESLAAQDDPRWELLWRDDGSRDGSVRIMEAFAARIGEARVRRIAAPAGNLGVAGSFLALLRAAPADAARFAFCDQDDVWLPQKLGRAARALDGLPPRVGGLYCARQVMVDASLRRIGLSPPAPRGPGFANAVVQNIATGCSIVLDAAARARLLAAPPPPAATLHDWWCYLVVTATGGRVVFDAEPALLYRQHGGNTVGGAPGLVARARGALRRGGGPFLAACAANLDAIAACPGLTAEARRVMQALEGLRSPNALTRLRALRRADAHRQGVAEDLLLRLWVARAPLPGRVAGPLPPSGKAW